MGENDRNDRNTGYRNRDYRGQRFSRREGGGFSHGQNQGRGRPQRPLLTSAINGAGLTLIALVLLLEKGSETTKLWCSGAVIAFGVSAIISYFAQRMRGVWIEKLSDIFFLIGAVILVSEAAHLGGLLN